MINLLPPQGKKLVAREYIFRVSAVAGFVCAFFLLASAVALVPTYILFSPSGAGPSQEEKGVPSEEEYMQLVAELKEASGIAAQLNKKINTVAASSVVTHIEDALFPDITLAAITFSEEAAQVRISVRGTARTRESLRSFLDTLKKDPFFADAQVPVSELARDTNVQFTMTLTLKPS